MKGDVIMKIFGRGGVVISGSQSVSIVNGSIFVNGKKIENGANTTTTKKIDEEKTLDFGSTKRISIFSSTANINVIYGKRSDVKIKLYGEFEANDQYTAEILTSMQSSNLEIKTDKGTLTCFSGELTLDVFIPESFDGEINSRTNSGDLSVQSLKLDCVDFESQSGDLRLHINELNALETQLQSGDVKLTCQSCSRINVSTMSGNVKVRCDRFKRARVKTMSGDIEFKTIEASVEASAMSGDIDNEFRKSTSNNIATLSTMSGDISAERI